MINNISTQEEKSLNNSSLNLEFKPLLSLTLYTARKITQSDLKELCFIRNLNNLKVNNQITNLTKGKYKRSVKQ